MIDQIIELLRLVGAGVVGGLVVAFASHRLTIRRERELGKANRKREFLAFLRQWRSEIHSYQDGITSGQSATGFQVVVRDMVQAAYLPRRDQFQAEVERVRDAFRDSQAFRRLADHLAGLDFKRCENKQEPREVILEGLDTLIHFAEHA